MAFDLTQAGMSVGYHSEEMPSTFFCKDFPGTCCEDCHKEGYVIAIYPWSCYSTGKEKMPDLSMGLRAEVCCGRFHVVRNLPREWWISKYVQKNKWSTRDEERLLKASPQTYLKTCGEIASEHYTGPRHYKAGPKIYKTEPRQIHTTPKGIKPQGRGCPSCGSKWDGVVCDNCGHS